MRIQDSICKCVGFVVSLAVEDRHEVEYDLEGTGFFVTYPSKVPGVTHSYFVTAKHILFPPNVRFGVLVRLRDAGSTVVSIKEWVLHPEADVAIASFEIEGHHDIVVECSEDFIVKEQFEREGIGLGDDVVFPGLFEFVGGRQPIVRFGNIAMLPADQVPVLEGDKVKYIDAFLIEARSVGGLSGSPVYVVPTTEVTIHEPHYEYGSGRRRAPAVSTNRTSPVRGLSKDAVLIGMIYGHWDDKTVGPINVGVGIVTPASKIIETLELPKLQLERASREEQYQASSAATPD